MKRERMLMVMAVMLSVGLFACGDTATDSATSKATQGAAANPPLCEYGSRVVNDEYLAQLSLPTYYDVVLRRESAPDTVELARSNEFGWYARWRGAEVLSPVTPYLWLLIDSTQADVGSHVETIVKQTEGAIDMRGVISTKWCWVVRLVPYEESLGGRLKADFPLVDALHAYTEHADLFHGIALELDAGSED